MLEISLKAEELFYLKSFPVTNSLVVALFILIVLSIFGLILRKKIKLIPGYLQSLAETALEGLLGLMDSVLGDRKKSEKFFPLVATIFLTVITSNWLGLLPGVGSIGLREGEQFIPLFRSPSADLNFTIAMAISAVVGVNIFGIITVGFFRYIQRFFTLKNPIYTFVGLLEFICEFAKMLSFSFRLFGNIFAGEILLTVVGFLIPFIVPLPFLFLEIFVGFIQAFVFATLTMIFIAIATVETEH